MGMCLPYEDIRRDYIVHQEFVFVPGDSSVSVVYAESCELEKLEELQPLYRPGTMSHAIIRLEIELRTE